jgi:hypothetical protein
MTLIHFHPVVPGHRGTFSIAFNSSCSSINPRFFNGRLAAVHRASAADASAAGDPFLA